MEEAGGRECEESRVEDRRSYRSNEMEGRSESDRGGDEVYSATFGNEEKKTIKTGLMMMIGLVTAHKKGQTELLPNIGRLIAEPVLLQLHLCLPVSLLTITRRVFGSIPGPVKSDSVAIAETFHRSCVAQALNR